MTSNLAQAEALAHYSDNSGDLRNRPLGGRLRAIQVNLMLHPGTDIEFMGQPWV
jgi:hypothetical protein